MEITVKILILILLAGIIGCENEDPLLNSDEARDITSYLSYQEFEQVRTYLIEEGDKETYCSMYNDNPHCSINDFDIFLNPEIGQGNINCDPDLSDFNQITIRDWETDQQYYTIQIVRSGDIENENISVIEGMREKKIYLLKRHDYNLEEAVTILPEYIEAMKDVIK